MKGCAAVDETSSVRTLTCILDLFSITDCSCPLLTVLHSILSLIQKYYKLKNDVFLLTKYASCCISYCIYKFNSVTYLLK